MFVYTVHARDGSAETQREQLETEALGMFLLRIRTAKPDEFSAVELERKTDFLTLARALLKPIQ